MPDKELAYSLEITNGYVFRQIFELYIKLIIQSVPIFFSEDCINIRTGTNSDNGRKLISDIEILSDDIIEYYFNKDLADIKEEGRLFILEQFNNTEINNNFKSITKTHSLRLFKEKDSKFSNIQTIGLTNDVSYIECSKYQNIEYDLGGFDDISDKPNIRIDINQFSSIMKGMTKGDPDYISFKVYPEGLKVESWNNSGLKMRNGHWGDITGDNFYETKVNLSIIKALCKIKSMITYSIIKVYSCKDGYLKIFHKIGDFGSHNIYLIDKKEDNDDD